MTSIAGNGLTQQLYQRLFDHLDVDKSQGISLGELKAVGGDSQDYASAFKALDADGDGQVARTEMTGSAVAYSDDTLSALLEAQAGSASKTILPVNKGLAGLLDGERSEQETQDLNALFARADVDKDGKLSDTEWEAEKALRRASTLDSGVMSGPVFIAMDVDGDGMTSAQEVRAGQLQSKPLTPSFFDEQSAETQQAWLESYAHINTSASEPGSAAPPILTSEEKAQIRNQVQADWAQRSSAGEGAYRYLDREIDAYRSAARADFSSLALSDTLVSRLMKQLVDDAKAAKGDLTRQVVV